MTYKKNRPEIIKKIETRIRTTMIGSLARFEEAFGEVLDSSDHYAELWDDVRTKILNNGNHQIRLATEELEDLIFGNNSLPKKTPCVEKYHYKFNINQDRREDEDKNI